MFTCKAVITYITNKSTTLCVYKVLNNDLHHSIVTGDVTIDL